MALVAVFFLPRSQGTMTLEPSLAWRSAAAQTAPPSSSAAAASARRSAGFLRARNMLFRLVRVFTGFRVWLLETLIQNHPGPDMWPTWEVCRHPDGSPVKLGCGGFCKARIGGFVTVIGCDASAACSPPVTCPLPQPGGVRGLSLAAPLPSSIEATVMAGTVQ